MARLCELLRLRRVAVARNWRAMAIIKNMFTWWEGSGFTTWLSTRLSGTRIGGDALGNVYYQGTVKADGLPRRWVIYSGANDASRVPPEWHGWLHGTIDASPDEALPPPRRWEKEATANLTGTNAAYLPSGALQAGGTRKLATGDYQAWTPQD